MKLIGFTSNKLFSQKPNIFTLKQPKINEKLKLYRNPRLEPRAHAQDQDPALEPKPRPSMPRPRLRTQVPGPGPGPGPRPRLRPRPSPSPRPRPRPDLRENEVSETALHDLCNDDTYLASGRYKQEMKENSYVMDPKHKRSGHNKNKQETNIA